MDFININLLDSSYDQLAQATDSNIQSLKLLCSQVEAMKKAAATIKKKVVIEEPIEEEKETIAEIKSYVDSDFEDEVDYYLKQLKELTSSNIDDKIVSVLPSRKHYQYERILQRLKLESIRYIKELKDLIREEGLSINDCLEFRDELNLELKKIALINKLLLPVNENEDVESIRENKLIFVPTTGGNVRVLEELSSMPSDYYERFNGLFQSIKNGTFKNVKRFSSNSYLQGLCEVKDFKTRVVFVRLSDDCYAVISAFIKKSDNDKSYRTGVEKKYADFLNVEDRLIANLDSVEFMEFNAFLEQELFNMLSQVNENSATSSMNKKKIKYSFDEKKGE